MCIKNKPLILEGDRFELSKKEADQIVAKYNTADIFDTYVKELFDDRKIQDDTAKTLFHSVYQPLRAAVKEGFGQEVVKVEYGTPNFEMLKNLQHNAGVFCAFKNHAMVKEMVGLLKDKDGNLKPFQQFKTDAMQIDGKYRESWLKVEYDTAVRSSRMAAQWERIQRTKHLYPNLEYIQTKAASPDPDHLALVGIVRPVDDPFWSTHYPPNRWKCQCSVAQTDKEASDIPDGLPDIPKEFAFNSGKLGQVFNLKETEYIKSVSKAAIPILIKMAEKEVNKDIVKELDYQRYYTTKNGQGQVDVHPLAINNSDFKEVLETARSLANTGKKVKILPVITDKELRKLILPLDKIKGDHNPDFMIDEKFVADLKTLNGFASKTVQNAIKSCNEQCDNIVISVAKDNPIEYNDLLRWIKGKVKYDNYKDFNNIWIYQNEKWNFLTREMILKMDFGYKSK